MTPLLREGEESIAQAWSAELEQPPADSGAGETDAAQDRRGRHGALAARDHRGAEGDGKRRRPRARSRPSDPSGYTVFGNVYINNGSDAALDASMLSGDYAAKLGAEGPQVLIIHTHGSESYTMPRGRRNTRRRTRSARLDTRCNMVRIGDEMAQVLTDAGIGVVHDRSLYDYPSYSGAYDRSLKRRSRAILQKYPTRSRSCSMCTATRCRTRTASSSSCCAAKIRTPHSSNSSSGRTAAA